MFSHSHLALAAVLCLCGGPAASGAAQQQQQPPPSPPPTAQGQKTPGATTTPAKSATPPRADTGVTTPSDYVIGADDVLGIIFWRDAEMSGDVTVRPDGLITLPLLRDVKAVGLKPDELREQIQKAAAEYIQDPNVTVVVRQIRSRNVYVTGMVARPGAYPLTGSTTVMQMIAIAGGLSEWARSKEIRVVRVDQGKSTSLPFNYQDVARGKGLEQNVILKPGDTVVVP